MERIKRITIDWRQTEVHYFRQENLLFCKQATAQM